MTVLQMVLIALFFACCVGVSPANSLSQFVGGLFNAPIAIGCVVGVIMGDVATGAKMGANIQLIYLGVISVGGETPANPGFAAIFGIPLAMASGLAYDQAVSLAVPFGIIGSVMPTIIRNFHLFFMHRVQKAIEAKNIKATNGWFFGVIPVRVLLQAICVFIGLYGGSALLQSILGALPDTFMSALGVVGKTLPCVGFAVGIAAVIKKNVEIIYFVLAFLAVQYLGVPVIVCTLVAVLLCVLKYAKDFAELKKSVTADANNESAHLLTWKDLAKYEAYRWCFGQNIFNYEDYNGTGKAVCLWPLLKKLYPNDVDARFERMKAHEQYFNCNVVTESLIFGMVASMEEEKAAGKEVPDEAISAVKAGLMGPLAGVGDSFIQGIVSPLVITLCMALIDGGNTYAGFLFPVITAAYTIIFAVILFTLGYKGGKVAMAKLFSSNIMTYITTIGSIVALVSFGALASNAIGVKLVFAINNVTIQSLLDTIMKGILPISLTLGVYSCLKKGHGATKMILIVFVAAFVLCLLGVIGA